MAGWWATIALSVGPVWQVSLSDRARGCSDWASGLTMTSVEAPRAWCTQAGSKAVGTRRDGQASVTSSIRSAGESCWATDPTAYPRSMPATTAWSMARAAFVSTLADTGSRLSSMWNMRVSVAMALPRMGAWASDFALMRRH